MKAQVALLAIFVAVAAGPVCAQRAQGRIGGVGASGGFGARASGQVGFTGRRVQVRSVPRTFSPGPRSRAAVRSNRLRGRVSASSHFSSRAVAPRPGTMQQPGAGPRAISHVRPSGPGFGGFGSHHGFKSHFFFDPHHRPIFGCHPFLIHEPHHAFHCNPFLDPFLFPHKSFFPARFAPFPFTGFVVLSGGVLRQETGVERREVVGFPPPEASTQAGERLRGEPPEKPALTLLALKDGTIYGLTDYWLQKGRLYYVTSYGAENSVPLEQVDLEVTVQLNWERGVVFVLRPGPTRQ